MSDINKKIAFICSFVYLCLVLYMLTFNPNFHHDGILLSAGDATYRGLVPHSDYIFIWGPLLPYILAIPMHISENLITLRFFGYFFICLAAYLLYLINIKITSKKLSILISLTWLLAYPPFSMFNGSKWPLAGTTWPNIYGFILILISINLLNFATNQKILRNILICISLSASGYSALRQLV